MPAAAKYSGVLIALCIATQARAITNGAIASGDESVVLIIDAQSGARCTGTLVAPDLVVLATHCVAEVDASGHIQRDVSPEQLTVFVGVDAPTRTGGSPNARGARVFRSPSDSIASGDLAVLQLARAITNHPIAPVRLDAGVRSGDRVAIVGYGRTHTGKLPRARHRRDGVHILSTTDIQFETGEGPCYADSGAPAFDANTGALVGVFSGGSNVRFSYTSPASPCLGNNVRNRFTTTASARTLLLDAFAAARATPWLEREVHPALIAWSHAAVAALADALTLLRKIT